MTGSRGMGKSSWQMHVLWSLAKLGAEAEHKDVAVIMQDNLHDYKYKFCRSGTSQPLSRLRIYLSVRLVGI